MRYAPTIIAILLALLATPLGAAEATHSPNPDDATELRMLTGSDLDAALAARRRLIARGGAGRAVVLGALPAFPYGVERLRLLATAEDAEHVDSEQRWFAEVEYCMRLAERHEREHPGERAVLLTSPEPGDRTRVPLESPLATHQYYSFPRAGYGSHQASVALQARGRPAEFNPPKFRVSLFGGWSNEIVDLGATTKRPATWPDALELARGEADEYGAVATDGHSYAVRSHDDQGTVDEVAVFRALRVGNDNAVIAWTPPGTRSSP